MGVSPVAGAPINAAVGTRRSARSAQRASRGKVAAYVALRRAPRRTLHVRWVCLRWIAEAGSASSAAS
eukprot:355105-Chlamydomonas_euryale.AAC.3